jgi:hypothetical protein
MMEHVFAGIYRRRLWGDGESVSGLGSGLERTKDIRADLVTLTRTLGVRSMLDAGCGDFHWMQASSLDLDVYVAVDVVRDLVDWCARHYAAPWRRFEHLDLTIDPLPRVDLILCRDVLPHFSFEDIDRAVANFRRSGSTWLLTNSFINRESNEDIPTGSWRPLNLEQPPFSFPTPAAVIDERCHHTGGLYADKRLSLWLLADLRSGEVGWDDEGVR